MSNVCFYELNKNNLSYILDFDGDMGGTPELIVILLQILNPHINLWSL
jgi:hypothetical protein